MAAGESADQEAARLEEEARRLRERADQVALQAENYRTGAAGERTLEGLLTPLRELGYVLIPDRCIPGRDGNIDMVVVGPTGVFVVDAKRWSGTVSVGAGMLRQNGHARGEEVAAVAREAEVVRGVLAQALSSHGRTDDVPVEPMICFVGDAALGGLATVDGVTIVDGLSAYDVISRRRPVITAEWTTWIADRVAASLAERTSGRESELDDLTVRAPDEPIVFLTRWNRYGHKRIYVKDENGADGGHLDLRQGVAVDTTPTSEAVMAHLLRARLQGSGDRDFDEEEVGVIRRFLANLFRRDAAVVPRMVVGSLWSNYDRKRLYVSVLEPDGRSVDMGWYDLRDDRVHVDLAGAEPAVRYCGRRYAVLEQGAGQ